MKNNLVVTLANKRYIEQAKQVFSSLYFNAAWRGDYMLLAYQVPQKDLTWFLKRGIIVKKCEKMFTYSELQKLYQQKNVFERFHKDTNEQAEQRQSALSAFKDSPSIEKLLELCDSNKRWKNFNRVKGHHALLKNRNFAGDYAQEILWPRNCLAHGVPERKGDGSLLFRFSGKAYSFDDNASQDLRKKILEYKSTFTEIVEALA